MTPACTEQVGLDVDASALRLTAANCEQFEGLHVDLVHANVEALPRGLWADTVVMCASHACMGTAAASRFGALHHCRNPPFGTRKKGADIMFLHAASGIARRAIYSLHKARSCARACPCVAC